MLYERLQRAAAAAGLTVGWSTEGFCGIPPHDLADA
jgi:hypothetical protein